MHFRGLDFSAAPRTSTREPTMKSDCGKDHKSGKSRDKIVYMANIDIGTEAIFIFSGLLNIIIQNEPLQ